MTKIRPSLHAAGSLVLVAWVSGPVLAGVWGTVQIAMSHPDGAGQGLRDLLAWRGLVWSMIGSLGPGLATTAVSLALVLVLLATTAHRPGFAVLRRMVSPLLAVPHAAAAIGLAFVIAPSGWIARALSPWATGWQVPPDLLIVGDSFGLSLSLGLVAKEVPFLLLMALTLWPQLDAPRRLTLMASLGHGRVMGFVIAVLPALYARLRLPVYAVLAYAMTSVEMGRILGPGLPPPLSVQITLWLTEPSLASRPLAAAGAGLQLALVALALALWRGAEIGIGAAFRALQERGIRGLRVDRAIGGWGIGLMALILGLTFAGFAALALWSVAGLWEFGSALPARLSLTVWQNAANDMTRTVAVSAALGISVAVTATVLAFGVIRRPGLIPLIYLPLILPQVAFLPGLTALFLRLGLADSAFAVGAMHLVFVLPYAVLSLSGPVLALDPRLALTAASLGASPARIFWRVHLPVLLGPVLTTLAVSFAVGLAQYLPTVLAGGGRIETLSTEAVALASGGNRRLAGAYGTLQLVLPVVAFALAAFVPRFVYRNRSALRGP